MPKFFRSVAPAVLLGGLYRHLTGQPNANNAYQELDCPNYQPENLRIVVRGQLAMVMSYYQADLGDWQPRQNK
jgi:hypothetical protein